MEITGTTALVTGAAHRVGKGIATGLARAGAELLIHYRSSPEQAEATAAELRDLGARVTTHQADLSDLASIESLLAAADRPIQLLVNSAAGFPTDSLRELTREGWQRTLDINLTAPIFVTRAFAAALPGDLQGAVVNVTDWKTVRPYRSPPHFSYTIAKGGIDTFTRVAAVELGPQIRVNAVALGVILPPPGESEEYAARLAESLPVQRVGGVEVVGRAVVELVENDFITGEIVHLDGGGHLV